MSKVKIIQDSSKPLSVDILAQSIVEISDAMRKINESALTRKALLVLLSHSTKQGQREIDHVLNAIEELRNDYVKKGR